MLGHVNKIDVQDPADVATPVAPPLEWPAEKVIRPAKRRVRVRDLFGYVPIIRVLASRDLKVKYKQSVLGPIWLVFQPLAMLAAFLVAFRGLADVESAGVPYVAFALARLS